MSLAARHSQADDSWRTPSEIIDPAHLVLGGIDLDPASSSEANKGVRARRFMDVVDNGFLSEWDDQGKPSTVFLNPPGGQCDQDGMRVIRRKGQPPCEESGACGLPPGHVHRAPIVSSAKAWWFKLAHEYAADRVSAAIFLGFSVEILQTTQVKPPTGLVLPLDFPLCFPSRRIPFLDANGKPVKGNTHASVIVFLPDITERRDHDTHVRAFAGAFTKLGRVRA